MRRYLKTWLSDDESGNANLEFVALFPLIILLFCSAFEAGTLSIRQVMLDSATHDVVRHLRLASNTPPTRDTLTSLVCDRARVFPDCANSVSVELAAVDTTTWNIDRGAMGCNNRTADGIFKPATQYIGGDNNDLMILRICAVFEPVFPTVGLGAAITRINATDYAIVSVSAFVNEPTS